MRLKLNQRFLKVASKIHLLGFGRLGALVMIDIFPRGLGAMIAAMTLIGVVSQAGGTHEARNTGNAGTGPKQDRTSLCGRMKRKSGNAMASGSTIRPKDLDDIYQGEPSGSISRISGNSLSSDITSSNPNLLHDMLLQANELI